MEGSLDDPSSSATAAAAASSSSPPLHPQQPPPPPPPLPPPQAAQHPLPVFHHHHSNSIPQIAQLLYREGDAWASLLALHSGVINTVQNVTSGLQNSHPLHNNVERELQYCASLSHAAAQCDSLHAEIVRLRHLRKARSSFDLAVLQPLFASHTDEALATGCSLASQASLSLQSVASEVRNAIQDSKRIEQELTSLHDALASFPSTTIPTDIKVSLGGNSIPLASFVDILKRNRRVERRPDSPTASSLDLAAVVSECSEFGEARGAQQPSSSSSSPPPPPPVAPPHFSSTSAVTEISSSSPSSSALPLSPSASSVTEKRPVRRVGDKGNAVLLSR